MTSNQAKAHLLFARSIAILSIGMGSSSIDSRIIQDAILTISMLYLRISFRGNPLHFWHKSNFVSANFALGKNRIFHYSNQKMQQISCNLYMILTIAYIYLSNYSKLSKNSIEYFTKAFTFFFN